MVSRDNDSERFSEGVPAQQRDAYQTGYADAVAEVSHELKNIIQRITTPVNQLGRRLPPEAKEQVADVLSNARRGVQALTEFTKGVEWLVHGRELSFARLSLRAVVKEVVDSVAPSRGITFYVPSSRDFLFEGVNERLVRALANIVRNAVEASPDNGTVIIDAFGAMIVTMLSFALLTMARAFQRKIAITGFILAGPVSGRMVILGWDCILPARWLSMSMAV